SQLSQNKPAQIFLLQDSIQPPAHVAGIDDDFLGRQLRRLVTDLLNDALEDGVQPAGADILRRAVHLKRNLGERGRPVGSERQINPLGSQEFGVLVGQRVLRLSEDAQKVLLAEIRQFDADRKTAL